MGFHQQQSHLDAFLLAVASSTDNLLVGISVGLSSSSRTVTKSRQTQRQSLLNFYKVNFVVAICNSAGTLIATLGGETLRLLPEEALRRLAALVSTSSSPETYAVNISIESLLAALAFLYLAWKEYRDDDIGEPSETKEKNPTKKVSYQIALPMTLNNLAGGIAGGVLGLSALKATFYAFVVSFGSMALGHVLACHFVSMHWPGNTIEHSHSKPDSSTQWCKYLSILIYLALGLQSLFQI